jgi:hypothetical protein
MLLILPNFYGRRFGDCHLFWLSLGSGVAERRVSGPAKAGEDLTPTPAARTRLDFHAPRHAMTSTGLLLIPLGFALLLMPWRVIIVALPSFALLQGAAVINVGSVGLQPGYFLALLVIARTGMEIMLLKQPLNRDALALVAPLGVFVLISVLVLWISVAFFTGKITVIGGTDAYVLENAGPYMFRRENITQISYIVINAALVYALAHQGARFRPPQLVHVIDRGFTLGVLLALFFCGWQLLAHATGIYFPTGFLFSNAGYFRADNQGFFGSLRLNGAFSEPSALAYFFSGFLLYFWKRARLQPTIPSAALVVALIGAIFLAYSTTGYFVLAIFAVIAAIDVMRPVLSRLRAPRLTWRKAALAALLLLAAGGATTWVLHNRNHLARILDVSLVDKSKSQSFAARTGAEAMALDVIARTGGIGIGLGSHKPNSLTLTLLSNVGVVGTGVFLLFVLMLLRPAGAPSGAGRRGLPFDETPLRYLLIGMLLVHAISNPNFNVVLMWTACGLLAGYHACVRGLAARPARSAPVATDWAETPPCAPALDGPRRVLLPPRSPGPTGAD